MFSKISNEKITVRLMGRCVLWAGASYGPGNRQKAAETGR
jgi:hypothetical protein